MLEKEFWTRIALPIFKNNGLHAERVEVIGRSGRPDVDVLHPFTGRVARVELKVVTRRKVPMAELQWRDLPWSSPAQPIELIHWKQHGGDGGCFVMDIPRDETTLGSLWWFEPPTGQGMTTLGEEMGPWKGAWANGVGRKVCRRVFGRRGFNDEMAFETMEAEDEHTLILEDLE